MGHHVTGANHPPRDKHDSSSRDLEHITPIAGGLGVLRLLP